MASMKQPCTRDGNIGAVVVEKVKCAGKSVNQARDRVNATITNSTPFAMTLLKSNNWAGTPEDVFPRVIPANHSATFTHLSQGDYGSRAVVIYASFNAALVPCAWILAWDAPTNLSAQTPNRVYVDCGRQSIIENIPWSMIEMGLQNAPDSNSDQETTMKTKVSAKFDDKVPGSSATLEADFGLIM